MEWNLFWTVLAQLGILSVAGIFISAIVRLWWIWWPSSPDSDHVIMTGSADDYH